MKPYVVATALVVGYFALVWVLVTAYGVPEHSIYEPDKDIGIREYAVVRPAHEFQRDTNAGLYLFPDQPRTAH